MSTEDKRAEARLLEARIVELRKVEYPTMAQMAELKRLKLAAGRLNEQR
jgi:hypothetical protein